MGTSQEHRDLGMDRPIARRDFLNGVAIGIAGVSAALSQANAQSQASEQPGNYPPTRSGLRGNYPAAVAEFDHIRSGQYTQFPVPDSEIREEYDLVIVGGGISGLAAAHFYRTALGNNQRILILDNHDDFGGHAKRNEFRYQGRTLIGVGGTLGIATPFPYSYAAKSLVKELGIEVERNAEFLNHELVEKYDLAAGTFFDKEHFGEDRLVRGNPRLPDFFAKAPLSEAARRDLIRLHGKNPDYMAGMSAHEKRAKLAKMSYQDYLLNVAKMSPDALPFFIGAGGRNNKRVDTTPALEAGEHGLVGFNGLGLKLEEGFSEASYLFHFPDGNASLARLLISKLIPAAVPGKQSMNTIVDAPVAYDRLDEPNSKMRIRLSSPVVRVQNEGPAENATSVRIAYRNGDKLAAVRGRYCILACYNALIPALLPEIPDRQKEALAYPVKVPMMYTNVLIRRWTAWQKLGVSRVSAPGMYHTTMSLDPGSTVGGYRGLTTPDEPIVVHMVRSPNKPGLPRKEQNRAGQQELLSMSFEDFELKIRQQMARTLAPGGFDPREDILAITVNRWPYGYAYTYDTLADPDVPFEQRPHVLGRQRCGRVTIANSDAGAAAFTNQAIDEANRAVHELFLLQGLS
ncbi:MAG TPA: NAD(P)/FAD-dependent oxidoreductase [Bryobacteraceae bacterium]|nr:NAD(P)/FAD-dependent oxidoreductase [Bryobacteraceae bacterium]